MSRILKRNIRFWIGTASFSILIYLAVIAFIFLIQLFGTPGDRLELLISRFPFIIIWGGIILLMTFQITVYQVYIVQVLSCGSRRIEAFWGIQVMNLFVMLIFYGMYMFAQRIVVWLGYEANFERIGSVIFLSGLIFAGGIGSMLGYFIIKLGGKGIILQVIVFAFIGGLAGATFSLMSHGDPISITFLQKYVVGIFASALVIYLIGAWLEYRQLKTFEVRC